MASVNTYILNNKEYPIEIIRKNNKNTYLRVKEGKIIVTTNYLTSSFTINKLIKDIEEVREKTPNEIDKVEKKRLEEIDNLLDKFKEVNTSDNELKEFIEKQYNN